MLIFHNSLQPPLTPQKVALYFFRYENSGSVQARPHQRPNTTSAEMTSAHLEEDMKKLVVLGAMVLISAWSTLAFAEGKMIGTVQSIRMSGSTAEMTLKDRKTDQNITLKVNDAATMEKLKDKKIRVGDEMRIRYDEGSKTVKKVQKTAGC